MWVVKIPWDSITPQLLQARADGATWGALADAVNDRFDTAITPQAVRYRLERVEVFAGDGGYALPTSRGVRGPKYTPTQVVRALKKAAGVHGRSRTGAPVSIGEYTEYKASLPKDQKDAIPSVVAIRRMFGSWNAALEAAGMEPGPRWRDSYEGLSKEDIVIHVAHFLRWMRSEHTGEEATSARYQQWVRLHPQLRAASWELVRWHGTWVDTVTQAADMEHHLVRLPAMKPVQPGGAKKTTHTVRLD